MNEPPLQPYFASASDPILVLNRSGSVCWANPAAQQLFRGTPLLGASVQDLLPTSDAQRILDTVHRASFDLSQPLGSLALKLSASVLELADGTLDGGALFILLQGVAAEGSALSREHDFLSTIAHDLKNPIGAIFGYADALLDTPLGAGLTPKQLEIVQRIRSTTSRSLEMVRNYQYLAQLDSPLLFQTATVTDANAVVDAVIQHSWRPAHDVQLKVLLYSNPLLIRAERAHLERIFSNLLHNAIKFTPPKGEITVRSEQVDKVALFEFFNSGSFIPQDERAAVFHRFRQGGAGRARGGTGLGLFIVASLVKNLGGEVSIESSRERGTSFIVKLPRVVNT